MARRLWHYSLIFSSISALMIMYFVVSLIRYAIYFRGINRSAISLSILLSSITCLCKTDALALLLFLFLAMWKDIKSLFDLFTSLLFEIAISCILRHRVGEIVRFLIIPRNLFFHGTFLYGVGKNGFIMLCYLYFTMIHQTYRSK